MAPPRKPRLRRRCLLCKIKIVVIQAEARRGGGKFCSHSCAQTYNQREGGFNYQGGIIQHRGYILEWAPKHPKNVKGYVYQHRLVIEKSLNKLLKANQVVHHKNHKKNDNRLCNLEVLTHAKHMRIHNSLWVKWDNEIINWTEAANKLGRSRASIREMQLKNRFTRQQVIEYYRGKLGLW